MNVFKHIYESNKYSFYMIVLSLGCMVLAIVNLILVLCGVEIIDSVTTVIMSGINVAVILITSKAWYAYHQESLQKEEESRLSFEKLSEETRSWIMEKDFRFDHKKSRKQMAFLYSLVIAANLFSLATQIIF